MAMEDPLPASRREHALSFVDVAAMEVPFIRVMMAFVAFLRLMVMEVPPLDWRRR